MDEPQFKVGDVVMVLFDDSHRPVGKLFSRHGLRVGEQVKITSVEHSPDANVHQYGVTNSSTQWWVWEHEIGRVLPDPPRFASVAEAEAWMEAHRG